MSTSTKETNIEKFTGSFSKEDGGCTIIVNSTINSIPDAFSCGLYTYLLCRPDNWKLNPKQLAEHYSCDKKTIYKSLTILQVIGLLTREDLREKGKFVKFHYVVHLHKKDISKPEKTQLNKGFSPVPVLPEMVKPEMVKRNAYKTKNIKNKEYKKTTTTRKPEKQKSSSVFVISKEIDEKLLSVRDKYLQDDELNRTDEEFLKQCSHHLDNGDKQKYNLARRLKGLETIIKSGFFEKPAGYSEKKVVKSQYSPEDSALIHKYQHALRMVSHGAKLEDYIADQKEVKRAMQLMEKAQSNKQPLDKRFGMMGFNQILDAI
jgi:predicted transcriptional regulator